MDLIVGLFAIFSAIVSALIAVRKNRSALGWLIGGLFFSVLAIIVVAVLRPLPVRALHSTN